MSRVMVDNSTAAGRGAGKIFDAVLWLLQVGAAGMFLMAGFSKLSGAPEMVGLFDVIGVGQWFRHVTGGLEVLGAVLLLVPRLSGVGALLLAGVMAGAVATHLFVLGGGAGVALLLLAVTAVIAWGRRARTARLLGR